MRFGKTFNYHNMKMYFKYLFEILIYVCHTLCVFSLLPQSLTIRSGLKTKSGAQMGEIPRVSTHDVVEPLLVLACFDLQTLKRLFYVITFFS